MPPFLSNISSRSRRRPLAGLLSGLVLFSALMTAPLASVAIAGEGDNPVPVLTALTPDNVLVGDAAFTLTVDGTGFVDGALVELDGLDRTTTFVSDVQLTAEILASDLTSTGSRSITVLNPAPGGGVSNALELTVLNPVPTLTSLSPTSSTVGHAAFSLTITGSDFVSSSLVRWDGGALTTAFDSSTRLTAQVPASALTALGTHSVTVSSPPAGGGVSSGIDFAVVNPTPALSSLSPSTTTAGHAAFSLTVTGSNFVTNSVVKWSGATRTTTYVSASRLTVAIPASDLTAVGSHNVTVFNPTPAGGTSNALAFSITDTTAPTVGVPQPSRAFANIANNPSGWSVSWTAAADANSGVGTVTLTELYTSAVSGVCPAAGAAWLVAWTTANLGATATTYTLSSGGSNGRCYAYKINVTDKAANRFTTAQGGAIRVDTSSPTVTTRVPASGATKVATTTNVSITFNEAVSGVSGSSLILRDTTTNAVVSALVAYNATTHVGVLNPNSDLKAGHQYSVSLIAAIKDLAGNPLAVSTTTFVTAPTVISQTYAFKGTVNYASSDLSMTETLDWTNRGTANVASLNLSVIPAYVRAFSLAAAVTADGLPTTITWSLTTNMNVRFTKPLVPGATIHIVIPFRLHLGSYSGAFSSRLGRYNGVMQFGEWFPVWSTAHGFYGIGDPQVSYNADKISMDLTNVGSTTLWSTSMAASGTPILLGTNHWIWRAANVKDFAFSLYPSYRVYSGTVNGTTVRAYSIKASGSTMLARTRAAFATYASWYGAYGAPNFAIAEVGSSSFSMEFPQMVFLGRDNASSITTLYHEVAHEWWYHLVGNNQMRDPFVDEAMATFSDRLALGIAFTSCGYGNVDSSVYAFSAWSGCGQYMDVVYRRGSQLINAIHSRMGNTAFFAAERAFLVKYRYANVTTFGYLDFLEAYNSTYLGDLIAAYTSR